MAVRQGLTRTGSGCAPATALCRTESALHPHKPSWIPARRRRHGFACRRCVARSSHLFQSDARRRRVSDDHVCYRNSGPMHYFRNPGPIHRFARARLRHNSHRDLESKSEPMRKSIEWPDRLPGRLPCACRYLLPTGAVTVNSGIMSRRNNERAAGDLVPEGHVSNSLVGRTTFAIISPYCVQPGVIWQGPAFALAAYQAANSREMKSEECCVGCSRPHWCRLRYGT
jgi:hypothetical protein